MPEPVGVLVMAYGGPQSLAEVEPYLRDVRGYRETPQHVVAEVRERYRRIGGRSPIVQNTEAQAAALARTLEGEGFVPVVGMRHWHPYIGDALARLAQRGIRRAVGLVMAPHYSRMSVGAYYQEVVEADAGVEVAGIESWHLLPGYLDAMADRVREGLRAFPADRRAAVPVVFTAHSLPERIHSWNDPYPAQLEETVRAVVARLNGHPHRFAYQSAGMSGEPWLGPDVGSTVASLATAGHRDVLVAPIGFVSEHVEILYDLDLELKDAARARGIRLERIAMLGDHASMIAGLAERVRQAAREAGWR